MQFRIIDGPSDTATLELDGKLDIAGAQAIEQIMAGLSGSKKGLIVDLAAVTFLASIGIRHLVSMARALGRQGGCITLLKPNPAVEEVLLTSGVTELMPISHSDSEARKSIGLSA